ncbi:MAG TPA: hypothetical protein VD963_06090 [Phycisphaerales bacterium]|nr:hypothetical protein [Phycisphaerales bacterium]
MTRASTWFRAALAAGVLALGGCRTGWRYADLDNDGQLAALYEQVPAGTPRDVATGRLRRLGARDLRTAPSDSAAGGTVLTADLHTRRWSVPPFAGGQVAVGTFDARGRLERWEVRSWGGP